MLFTRIARFTLPLFAALTISACVQVEQTLTLLPDGSGTLSVQYGMKLETIADLEARAKHEAEASGEEMPTPMSFDPEQVREDFKDYEPLGITLEEARSHEKDGFKYILMKMRFTSLAALAQTEFLSDRNIQVRRVSEGVYEFRPLAPPNGAAEMEEMRDMMRELLAGFRASLTVAVPGAVRETNADEQPDGRSARWVFDLEKDPEALIRAQKMDLRIVFAADGPGLPEFPAR
jgi:hypothetical protein